MPPVPPPESIGLRGWRDVYSRTATGSVAFSPATAPRMVGGSATSAAADEAVSHRTGVCASSARRRLSVVRLRFGDCSSSTPPPGVLALVSCVRAECN